MGTGLDLDEGGYRVARDLRDDAGERVPPAHGARRSIGSPLRDEPSNLGRRDPTLTALGADRGELPVALPTPKRLDPHADRLRRLSDPKIIHERRSL
jgi:hypothetical protein